MIKLLPALGTVRLGTHQSYTGLVRALFDEGVDVDHMAYARLRSMKLSSEPLEIKLFLASFQDLLLHKGESPKYYGGDLEEGIGQLGLKLCPDEVGPQMILQRKELNLATVGDIQDAGNSILAGEGGWMFNPKTFGSYFDVHIAGGRLSLGHSELCHRWPVSPDAQLYLVLCKE